MNVKHIGVIMLTGGIIVSVRAPAENLNIHVIAGLTSTPPRQCSEFYGSHGSGAETTAWHLEDYASDAAMTAELRTISLFAWHNVLPLYYRDRGWATRVRTNSMRKTGKPSYDCGNRNHLYGDICLLGQVAA